MIAIIDYGMGNLRSVQKAFERLGVPARIVTEPHQVRQAERLILPGVGAFRDAMDELRRKGLVEPIREHVAADKPFLGICLGLQLLFDVSHEDGHWEGLGIVPGEVVRFPDRPGLKIPHMGWNSVTLAKPCPLFAGVPEGASFYFVHSYHVVPQDESVVAAWSEHGERFVAAIARGRLFATQFHPEKSQQIGLHVLKNFAAV
ncbi:MAG: imidazole glycerol phosphate synthase subunit HisH [Planctomycetota bacterium]|nr:MAG: imidazole glycerol phosphate synthase subunit HisH [Planctomycetota bacterium]